MPNAGVPSELQNYSIYEIAEKIIKKNLRNIISSEIQNRMAFVNGCVRYM